MRRLSQNFPFPLLKSVFLPLKFIIDPSFDWMMTKKKYDMGGRSKGEKAVSSFNLQRGKPINLCNIATLLSSDPPVDTKVLMPNKDGTGLLSFGEGNFGDEKTRFQGSVDATVSYTAVARAYFGRQPANRHSPILRI